MDELVLVNRVPFENEGQLRKLIKRVFDPKRVLWIEPAQGSTVGIPDCALLMQDGRVVWAELKCRPVKDGGWVDPKLRPTQLRTMRLIRAIGGHTCVLVAEKGGRYVYGIPGCSLPTEGAPGKVLRGTLVRGWKDVTTIAGAITI